MCFEFDSQNAQQPVTVQLNILKVLIRLCYPGISGRKFIKPVSEIEYSVLSVSWC